MLHSLPHSIIRVFYNSEGKRIRTEYYNGNNWTLKRSESKLFKNKLEAAIEHDSESFAEKLAIMECFPLCNPNSYSTHLINCPLPRKEEATAVPPRNIGDFTISFNISEKLFTVGILGSKLSDEYKCLHQQHKRVFYLHKDGKIRYYATNTNGDKSGFFLTQPEAEAAIALYYALLTDYEQTQEEVSC